MSNESLEQPMEGRSVKSETVGNAGSEQRVKARWPKAYHCYPCESLTRIRTGVYPNPGIGDGCDESNAWDAACHHPSVVAFEQQHRPSAPQDAPSCGAEFDIGGETLSCHMQQGHAGGHIHLSNKPLVINTPTLSQPVAPDSGKGFEEWWKPIRDNLYFLTEEEAERAEVSARQGWDAHAALSSKPEGESTVTWRADAAFLSTIDGPAWFTWDFLRSEAEGIEALGSSYRGLDTHIARRLVKIETRETVVETRKKEA